MWEGFRRPPKPRSTVPVSSRPELEGHAGGAIYSESPAKPVAPAADDPFLGLPAGTSAWVGALGVTAALAAAGFIGKLAAQQLLGIELSNWSAVDLSIFAGHWAVDTLSIILEHPVLFLPIVLYLVPTLVSLSLPTRDPRGKLAARVSLCIATCGLLFVLLWCEAPSIPISGWLGSYKTSIPDQLIPKEPAGFMHHRTADIAATLIISKLNSRAYEGAFCDLASDKIPPAIQPHLIDDNPQRLEPHVKAQSDLETMYAICAVICFAALLTLYFHTGEERATLGDEIFRGVRLFDSLLLLPLVALLLPYLYGKLIYPTTFPQVSILWTDEVTPAPDTKKATPAKGAKEAAPATSVDTPATRKPDQILILDQNDKQITVFARAVDPGGQSFTVQINKLDSISKMERWGRGDVLDQLLSQCDWIPPSP